MSTDTNVELQEQATARDTAAEASADAHIVSEVSIAVPPSSLSPCAGSESVGRVGKTPASRPTRDCRSGSSRVLLPPSDRIRARPSVYVAV